MRRSEERRVGKSVRYRVEFGGRRIIKKKKKKSIKNLSFHLIRSFTVAPLIVHLAAPHINPLLLHRHIT